MSRSLCFAIACGLPALAIASPGDDPTAGRAVFTGSTLANATSIDLDPAALGIGTVNEIYVAATAIADQFGITPRTENLAGNLTPGPHLRDDEFAPGGMIAGIIHIGADRGTVGIAVRSDPTEMFFGNHESERYQTLGGRMRTYGGTVAGSVKITDELWFGLSFDLQSTYLRLHYALDTAQQAGNGPGGVGSACGSSPCGLGNPLASERFDIAVHSNFLSASEGLVPNIGLVYKLARDIWIGAAFHAPPGLALQQELDGTMDVTRAPRDGGALIRGGATVNVSPPASADGEVRARLADQLDLHIGARWVDLSRFTAFDVRGYNSVFAVNGIPEWTERPRGFHDSFAMWGGVEQIDTGDEWYRLGARIGFETSGVDNANISPMTIDPFSVTADLGVQVRLAPAMTLQMSYGVQYFLPVTVAKSAFDPNDRIACIDSGFDYSTPACASTRNGFAIATAAGDYDRIEHAVRIGLRYELP